MGKKDLQNDLGNLKEDVENLRAHTADLVSRLTDVSEDIVKSAYCRSKKAAKDASKTFKKNPVMAVVGALGLGALLGGIAKRLCSNKRR